jgi:hypothetical protein
MERSEKMAELSNKTLAFLLIGAIVVSLMGTLISVNKIGKGGHPIITGQATSGQGTAQIEILSTLAITLVTSNINFGQCTPGADNTTIFDSNSTVSDGTGPSTCSNMQEPQNITVQTIGNIPANITIQSSQTNITGGSNQSLFFAWRNSTDAPGCYRATNATWGWMNFSGINAEHFLCQNLTVNGRIWTYFRVWVPSDSVVGTRSAIITFTGRNVYGGV